MTAGLRAVTAPAALVVFLLALLLVLLLPDGLAHAGGRVSREVPHSAVLPSPLVPFAELPRHFTGYWVPQSRTPALAPPPEHPGYSRSGAPHAPTFASAPAASPTPDTSAAPEAPPLPGTALPFPTLPLPPLPSAPVTTVSPSRDPHLPESPSPSAASPSPGGGAAGAGPGSSPSRTGHGTPSKAAGPPAASRAVPAPPSLLPLAPRASRRAHARLPAPPQAPGAGPEKEQAFAEEMPRADEVPLAVGARGAGFLMDEGSRLALGGGLICLGCGLATALLAFRLRRV